MKASTGSRESGRLRGARPSGDRLRGDRLTADRGSGTVLVLVAIAVLVGVSTACLLVQQAIMARHRADHAADLAALGAAEQLRWGKPDPCHVAARIAAANGARLAVCAVQGQSTWVAVSVRPAGRLGAIGQATRCARAGPGT